ncbi:hypothetical protein AVEN_204683-1 [Araneus ventricosus]|uniref:Uncharacterized protein n=1 Tax=Araneus ventricosus TaxID=182803 RepID=A0A4Y2M325_ARAVE|nr:hypothetical protein AVEN_253958-1 [Araneus ventricosus]GBN21508.1 hypothetical protein AVEN_204683-1 [Araneus ventricosus]
MLLFLMPLQQLCHLDGHGTVHCVPVSERLLFRNDGIPTGSVQCNSAGGISRKTHSSRAMGLCLISCTTVLSYTKFMSPPAHRKSRTSAGLMVKEESELLLALDLGRPREEVYFVHCLCALAGCNGMASTLWVTLPGEKLQTYIAHSTQDHQPPPR